jgi:hypothetical protein
MLKKKKRDLTRIEQLQAGGEAGDACKIAPFQNPRAASNYNSGTNGAMEEGRGGGKKKVSRSNADALGTTDTIFTTSYYLYYCLILWEEEGVAQQRGRAWYTDTIFTTSYFYCLYCCLILLHSCRRSGRCSARRCCDSAGAQGMHAVGLLHRLRLSLT